MVFDFFHSVVVEPFWWSRLFSSRAELVDEETDVLMILADLEHTGSVSKHVS